VRGLLIGIVLLVAAPASAADEDRKYFVNEYVREVSQIVALRAQATKEMSPDASGKMADCIRDGTRFGLELGSDVSMMQKIKLTGEHAQSPGIVARIWDQERAQYQAMGELCETMMGGPKPGVDYGALAAKAPKITANVEYLDQTMFQASPLVAAALISDTPDKQGHMSRMILTKKERDELVHTLNISFPEIDAKNPKYLTAIGWVLREYVSKKGYKMADEP
jgi:hypothetical protein